MEAKKYLHWVALVFAIAALVITFINPTFRGFSDQTSDRAIDTVNVGTTPNDGTGDPLRTAFLKVNRMIVMADSLDLDSLTNAEVQSLKDLEDLTDAVLFHVGDTTVTAVVGKVVFKTSNAHFYGCVATSGLKWKILDNYP